MTGKTQVLWLIVNIMSSYSAEETHFFAFRVIREMKGKAQVLFYMSFPNVLCPPHFLDTMVMPKTGISL